MLLNGYKTKKQKSPKNRDGKCFHYTITAALNLENIGKILKRITKIMLFKNEYQWREKHFPAEAKDRKSLLKL